MSSIRIPLTSKRYPDLAIVIDEGDAELVRRYKWHPQRAGQTFYAITNTRTPDGKRIPLRLHHLILPRKDGLDVDHSDGDGLNNTRANLRYGTRRQNIQNTHPRGEGTSRYKGVWLHRQGNCVRWRAAIRIDGKQRMLGSFVREEDAARAYDDHAREHFGEFAVLNFPD